MHYTADNTVVEFIDLGFLYLTATTQTQRKKRPKMEDD